MYLDSHEGLYRENYYGKVKGFINFILFNPKYINGGRIN
jgi:hypothetical protein